MAARLEAEGRGFDDRVLKRLCDPKMTTYEIKEKIKRQELMTELMDLATKQNKKDRKALKALIV